jgi:hypothetical protein
MQRAELKGRRGEQLRRHLVAGDGNCRHHGTCTREWRRGDALRSPLEGALEEGSDAVGRAQPHHLGPDGKEPQHGVVLALERGIEESTQPALNAGAGLPVDVEAQEEAVAGEEPQRSLQQTPQLTGWRGLPLRVRVHQPHIPGPRRRVIVSACAVWTVQKVECVVRLPELFYVGKHGFVLSARLIEQRQRHVEPLERVFVDLRCAES